MKLTSDDHDDDGGVRKVAKEMSKATSWQVGFRFRQPPTIK